MLCIKRYNIALVIRQQGESQNGGNKESKARQIFQKTNIFYPLIDLLTAIFGMTVQVIVLNAIFYLVIERSKCFSSHNMTAYFAPSTSL